MVCWCPCSLLFLCACVGLPDLQRYFTTKLRKTADLHKIYENIYKKITKFLNLREIYEVFYIKIMLFELPTRKESFTTSNDVSLKNLSSSIYHKHTSPYPFKFSCEINGRNFMHDKYFFFLSFS